MSTKLKTLGQYVYDSIEGYRNAHDRAESAALKAAFARRADARGNARPHPSRTCRNRRRPRHLRHHRRDPSRHVGQGVVCNSGSLASASGAASLISICANAGCVNSEAAAKAANAAKHSQKRNKMRREELVITMGTLARIEGSLRDDRTLAELFQKRRRSDFVAVWVRRVRLHRQQRRLRNTYYCRRTTAAA